MKKNKFYYIIFLCVLIYNSNTKAQSIKACDITSVDVINKVLATSLSFDANSIINKLGKYECRYTDEKVAGRYIAIGLLESKIEYGNDLLKMDFESNKKAIAEKGKAGGIYNHLYIYSKGGVNAFYMTGDKNDYSPESFVFKLRKGNYIITFSAESISIKHLMEKIDAIFALFEKIK